MQYKAILWDNDGVLVDTEKTVFHFTKLIFRRIGVEYTEKLYQKYALTEKSSSFDLIREQGVSDEQIISLKEERSELLRNYMDKQIPIFPDALHTLKILSSQVRMGMVSSGSRPYIEHMHNKTGFTSYFEFIISGDDVRNRKPNPEPYLLALERLGLSPESCVVIEDTQKGLTAAHAAGIDCYVIPHDLTKDQDFSLAKGILNSISEVPAVLGIPNT